MPLFRKKTKSLENFGVLGVDLHNHVLPGLDDGAPHLDESIKMLNTWVELGYKKVITTPHVIEALYPNTRERILGQMYHLQEVIEEKNLPIHLEATAEYQLDFEFQNKLDKGELIPFGKDQFILIELPFQKPAFSIETILFDISLAGYEPILAHPERYSYFNGKMSAYEKLKDRGLLFQLNMNSLTGLYGKQTQKTAIDLINNKMIEFVGSDAHHDFHLQEIKKLFKNSHFQSLLDSGLIRNMELL